MRRIVIIAAMIALATPVSAGFGRGPRTDMTKFVGFAAGSFNMLPQRTDFGGATDFTFSGYTFVSGTASISGTPVLSPSGAYDAQHLTEALSFGQHLVQGNFPPVENTQTTVPYRLAVIAKAAERTRMVVSFKNYTDATEVVSVGFDLAGGNVGYDNAEGAGATLINANMSSLGGGWWLCILDVRYTSVVAGGRGREWASSINIDNGSGTGARQITYVGDGTSGINIWWFSQLPLAAWGMNKNVFDDEFDSLSTIDVNNTKAAGFKWYVNNEFPGSFMPTFGWETNPPSAPTLASNLSTPSPGIVKLYNPNLSVTGFTSQLWSVVSTGTSTVSGSTFRLPLVFDGYFNWDGVYADYYNGWGGLPAFWSVPVQALTGAGMTPTSHWNEWDVIEGGFNHPPALSGSYTVHDWSNPAAPVHTRYAHAWDALMYPGSYHRISSLWLDPATTGTEWGMIMFFLDGRVVEGSLAYSATSGSQPGNVVGLWQGDDNHDMVVIIDTAEDTMDAHGGLAMYLDWARVYTHQ